MLTCDIARVVFCESLPIPAHEVGRNGTTLETHIEPARDSSRYFVMRIQAPGPKKIIILMGYVSYSMCITCHVMSCLVSWIRLPVSCCTIYILHNATCHCRFGFRDRSSAFDMNAGNVGLV